MQLNYTHNIESYLHQLGYKILLHDAKAGIMKVANEQDGVTNLIIGILPPVLIFECYLFDIHKDDAAIFKSLLIKNRDILHGAFVINAEGDKLLYRYTIQIENIDFNEFESALNALSFLLNEYSNELIIFSKQLKN